MPRSLSQAEVADFRERLCTAAERLFANQGLDGMTMRQLDSELERGDWILEQSGREDAFTSAPVDLWEAVLTRKGGSYALVARMPVDPSMN